MTMLSCKYLDAYNKMAAKCQNSSVPTRTNKSHMEGCNGVT